MIMKRTKSMQIDIVEKPELLRTIRAGESFGELGDNLPKANYQTSKIKK